MTPGGAASALVQALLDVPVDLYHYRDGGGSEKAWIGVQLPTGKYLAIHGRYDFRLQKYATVTVRVSQGNAFTKGIEKLKDGYHSGGKVALRNVVPVSTSTPKLVAALTPILTVVSEETVRHAMGIAQGSPTPAAIPQQKEPRPEVSSARAWLESGGDGEIVI